METILSVIGALTGLAAILLSIATHMRTTKEVDGGKSHRTKIEAEIEASKRANLYPVTVPIVGDSNENETRFDIQVINRGPASAYQVSVTLDTQRYSHESQIEQILENGKSAIFSVTFTRADLPYADSSVRLGVYYQDHTGEHHSTHCLALSGTYEGGRGAFSFRTQAVEFCGDISAGTYRKRRPRSLRTAVAIDVAQDLNPQTRVEVTRRRGHRTRTFPEARGVCHFATDINGSQRMTSERAVVD